MADPVTTFTVASGVMNGVGSILKSQEKDSQYKAAQREAEYNAQQFRYDAQLARYEKAQAFNKQLAKGRQDIATGTGAMVAAGNYGTSAQAQIFGSALNLMKDLSAIQYKYDNEEIQAENAARIQDYNARQYKRARKNNKTSGLIGALLTGGLAAGDTYLNGVSRGLWKPFWGED